MAPRSTFPPSAADSSSPALDVSRALRALRALHRDPEDTAQVFQIIEALSGRHADRVLERIRSRPEGRRILARRPDLLQTLGDRHLLASLPDGTLGRGYLDFLEREQITTEGLVAASLQGRRRDGGTADLEYIRGRLRDMHDLWHVVTGYEGDLLGEAALLAFSFAQTWNPGVGVIVLTALVRGRSSSVRAFIAKGFVRGLRAAWFPVADWEDLIRRPLDEVRAGLRVESQSPYETYRSDQYLAAMGRAG